jgi:hypothetical protein
MTDHDAIEPEDRGEAVLTARRTLADVLQELDDRQATVKPKRGREPSLANARTHLADAIRYLGGSHVSMAAEYVALGAAMLDHAEGRPLTEALNDRWGQVRNDLPESLRESMPDRTWGGERRSFTRPVKNVPDPRIPERD